MNYIQTYTGKKVTLPKAQADQICIEDIARALSWAPRFAGHTYQLWSVAQHSIAVCDLVPEEHKLEALLHDGTEAYLCDIPTPFKALMPQYRELEYNLWEAVADRFGLPYKLAECIKHADTVMLMTERDLLCNTDRDWGEEYENIPRASEEIIRRTWNKDPDEVEELFLEYYNKYKLA